MSAAEALEELSALNDALSEANGNGTSVVGALLAALTMESTYAGAIEDMLSTLAADLLVAKDAAHEAGEFHLDEALWGMHRRCKAVLAIYQLAQRAEEI